MANDGAMAVLYYLGAYLFTTLAAFAVIALVTRHLETEDISGLAGLSHRSPLLAATMTLAMASLAGVPPLVGFFGKFLLFKAVIEQGAFNAGYYCLAFTALVGVVISVYYYFGVIRVICWSKDVPDLSPIAMSRPIKASIAVCLAGMLYLGLFPGALVAMTNEAARILKF